MTSTPPLTKDVLESIQYHLGKITADMYARFYSGKDQKIVLTSFQELLAEVIGPRKAEEELLAVIKKNNVSSL